MRIILLNHNNDSTRNAISVDGVCRNMIEIFVNYFSIKRHATRAVASSIIGGGGLIFIYSCSAQLISFEIDCFYGV